jgi:hypothetical protein
MSLNPIRLLGSMLALGAMSAGGCVSPQSPITQAAGDCPEFSAGAQISDSLAVDQTVRVFMQASSTFSSVTTSMKADVKTACENIAKDLGVPDTWSQFGADDKAISNPNGTGSCDAVTAKVKSIMEDQGALNANFALTITQGQCHLDFDQQKMCDEACDTQHACTPGTVETRCEPGQLSVKCDQNCTEHSFCEGSETSETQCSGSCLSMCKGHCSGACFHEDGTISMNDDNCHGKCTDTCQGTCSGLCQITVHEGFNCGSDRRCKGSCTGTFTDPVCESEFTPADCNMNQECHESCRAKIAANPICEPSTVQLFANIDAVSNKADVQKLVATLNANLSKLLDAAEQKGPIALNAVTKLSDTGQVVIDKAGNLDGHSLACAKVAAKADLEATNSLKLLNQGSANVTNTCKSHAK